MAPETRYARSGDFHLAYQVVGHGPTDLVMVPPFVSNVEHYWEDPLVERFLTRLTSFSRLILFDKRGTGMSDRVQADQLPTFEERMDDVRAVMDAAGSERAALFGPSEGGPMSALFAATYPERTCALIVRQELERFRGREVKTVGDGFLVTFDGPARAIRCAAAIRDGMRALGLSIRAGLHTGECEFIQGDVGGIAVHIASRVLTSARAGEVLVSSTVKDLVVGSGIDFEDRGIHRLRGVPGNWRLIAVHRAI